MRSLYSTAIRMRDIFRAITNFSPSRVDSIVVGGDVVTVHMDSTTSINLIYVLIKMPFKGT